MAENELLEKEQSNQSAPPQMEGDGSASAPGDPNENGSVQGNAVPSHVLVFAERFNIDTNTPYKDIFVGDNLAYSAIDSFSGRKCVAVLAVARSLSRLNLAPKYKVLKSTDVIKLLEYGILENGPDGREYFAFIFEAPPAKPVMKKWSDDIPKLSEENLLNSFIKPVLSALKEFHQSDMVHGNVNLRNIFFEQSGDNVTAMLGECLGSATGLNQHALYETPERALADPEARGRGSYEDDLYAFGMCVAIVAQGYNPAAKMDMNEIVHEKIKTSSFALIATKEGLPSSISEFLRGVLNDDKSMRWTFEDVEKWLDGRRLSPRQPRVQQKASRPFTFKEEKYYHVRRLAEAFTSSPQDASKVLSSKQIVTWIKRNFDEKVVLENLEETVNRYKSNSSLTSSRERFVTEAVMALDPSAPIRYLGRSVMPRALGNALAYGYATGQDVRQFEQIIKFQFTASWLSAQYSSPSDTSTLLSQAEVSRKALSKKNLGSGLERVAYYLQKDAVCMSPILKDFFVYSPSRLVNALDRLAQRRSLPPQVFDRHMAAFISIRDQKMIEPYLSFLNSESQVFRILGEVKVIAAIQKNYKLRPLVSLCDEMIERSGILLERFRQKEIKMQIAKALDSLRGTGDFQALLKVVDNEDMMRKDAEAFVLAKRQFRMIKTREAMLEQALEKRHGFGMARGRQVSMYISVFLGCMLFLFNIAFFISKSVF